MAAGWDHLHAQETQPHDLLIARQGFQRPEQQQVLVCKAQLPGALHGPSGWKMLKPAVSAAANSPRGSMPGAMLLLLACTPLRHDESQLRQMPAWCMPSLGWSESLS